MILFKSTGHIRHFFTVNLNHATIYPAILFGYEGDGYTIVFFLFYGVREHGVTLNIILEYTYVDVAYIICIKPHEIENSADVCKNIM